MSKAYILIKGKETKHTYSRNVLEQLKLEGWEHRMNVYGWNMSFTTAINGRD